MTDLQITTSMRITHYDTDGSYMYQYDACRRNVLYDYTLLYYHCLDVEENALSVMGLPALPYSFPYGSVGTIGRDTSIPIDNVYADEEEHVVPIDDYELPDIIYSDADTLDKTIDVAGSSGISVSNYSSTVVHGRAGNVQNGFGFLRSIGSSVMM